MPNQSAEPLAPQGGVSSRFQRARSVLALALGSAAFGCDPVPKVPSGPDLASLDAAYAQATAQLDKTTIESGIDRFRAIQDSGYVPTMREFLDGIDQPLPEVDGGTSSPGIADLAFLTIELQAHGTIDTPCDPKREDAGSSVLNFRFDAVELYPNVWGELKACQPVHPDQTQGEVVAFDGTFEVLLRKQKGFEPVTGNLLIAYDGRISINGESLWDAPMDFQYRAERDVTFRVPAVSGGYVLYTASLDGKSHRVRDIDQEWTCDLDRRVCENQAGDEVIRW